jgi:hypothetical protein
MKAVLKILGVILIGIGVIILIAGKSAASDALGLIILLLMGGIPAALGVLCLLKSKKKPDPAGVNVPDQPTVPPMPAAEPIPDVEPIQEPELRPALEEPAAPEPVKDPYKYYSFKVAGISFYEKDIINTLAVENDDYDMTKKEIADAYMTDENIYKYVINVDDVQLEPEPDNPHDPNAIKVVADGVLIGYVPARSTKRVGQILTKSPEIICNVYGGPSKIVFEESDGSHTMKKSDHNIGAEIILKYM